MKITANGISMNYTLDGPAGAPVVTLSHSLATDLSMWEPQMKALTARYRVLRYDTRGHGGTDAPGGAYSLSQLADDARALLEALGDLRGPAAQGERVGRRRRQEVDDAAAGLEIRGVVEVRPHLVLVLEPLGVRAVPAEPRRLEERR